MPVWPWVQAILPSDVVSGATSCAAAGVATAKRRRKIEHRTVRSLADRDMLDRRDGREEFMPSRKYSRFLRGKSMRLCTIMSGGKPAVGVKMGDGKIDRSQQADAARAQVGRRDLSGGKKLQQAVLKACAKPKAGATVSEKSAKYLCPIPAPGKILCIGLNYRKHAEETGSPIPTYPVVFTRFNNTLVPHNGKMLSTTPFGAVRLGSRAHHRDRQEVPQRAEGEGAVGDRAATPASTTARSATGSASRAASSRSARTSTAPAASVPTRHPRRAADGRRAAAHHDPGQWRAHAGQQHRRPDLRCADPGARALQGHDARSGRHHHHRHAVGRGDGAQPAALAKPATSARSRSRRSASCAIDRPGGCAGVP